jgi:hypothetical protein
LNFPAVDKHGAGSPIRYYVGMPIFRNPFKPLTLEERLAKTAARYDRLKKKLQTEQDRLLAEAEELKRKLHDAQRS